MKDYLFYNQIFIVVVLVLFLFWVIFDTVRSNRNLEELTEKYKLDSLTDSLTSLYNRKYFDMLFEDIISISKQNNDTSAFIIIDIDYFKQYNDIYGHQKGDEALILVANELKNCFSDDYHYCFRIGGEEFGVLVYNVNEKLIVKYLDNLKEKIKHLSIEHKASKTNLLTLSIGVQMIDQSTYLEESKEIYKLADSKLYNSKENGRDQYTL